MGQLEPGAGEGIGELRRILHEAACDRLVDRVEAQCEIGGGHHRCVTDARVVRIGDGIRGRAACWLPLLGAGGAVGELPLVAEQGLEVGVVPGDGCCVPRTLDATADGVVPIACALGVLPAEAHLLDGCALWLGADVLARIAVAVRLAERVTTGDEGNGLDVVHSHAGKGLANIAGRGQRIRVAVGAFRIDVDEAHLNGCERVREIAIAGVAGIGQPLGLGAPVGLVRLPYVSATATEAEGLEAHRLHRDVSGEDHEVGPGEGIAVLGLDRPQQAARLVEVDVVGPAVEGGEALHAGAAAATAIARAVGAGAVPGHAHEEGAVVAIICRPPHLGVGHDCPKVSLDGCKVEAVERGGVVEARIHRIGLRGVLPQDAKVQPIGPPIAVACALSAAVNDRAARCF